MTTVRTCVTCGSFPCRCHLGSARPAFNRQREACVCGGPDLIATSFLPPDVVAAVLQHQIEPVHIAYDLAHGIPLSAAQLQASAMDGDLTLEPLGGR